MVPSEAIQNSLLKPPDSIPLLLPSSRWIRVKFGGEIIADSRGTLLFRQYGKDLLPTYYFPQSDVRMDALVNPSTRESSLGETRFWDVKVGDAVAEGAAWSPLTLPPRLAKLAGMITFQWNKMEAWYEEEEQVFVHARDPFHRVDVLASSRHVRIVLGGQIVAETRRPYLLFETSLPTRFYIPQEDIRMDLLEPTSFSTRCPYKGIASYWSAHVGNQEYKNIVWGYLDPIPENPKIKGLLSFFNEKVDVYVDDVLQERPKTVWSE